MICDSPQPLVKSEGIILERDSNVLFLLSLDIHDAKRITIRE